MKPVIIIALSFVVLILTFIVLSFLNGLTFIVLGLFLDILGIWILAGPLLRIVFKNEDDWNKRVQLAKDAYQRERKNLEGRKDGEVKSTDWVVTGVHFARLEAYLYRVLNILYKDMDKQRRLAYIGLSIITTGFIFQIIGNILQSFEI